MLCQERETMQGYLDAHFVPASVSTNTIRTEPYMTVEVTV